MFTAEEKRGAVDRVLESKTFARSEQLRAFLRYVCDAEAAGKADSLTEYLIGVEVFRRPQGYSPAVDSSVRTRAHELRQRIERVYTSELKSESVQVSIPKGSYTPIYTRIAPEPDMPAATSEPKPVRSGRWRIAAVGFSAGLLAALIVLQFARIAPGPAVDRLVRQAWAPFASPNADVLLCPATPLHLVVGPAGHEAYGSRSYPAPPEAYDLFRQHRPLAPEAKLGLLFTDNVLGVGTMNAVVTATGTLRALGSPYQVLPERVATISALRGRNAILFGAPVDSEAITRTTEKAPLTVDYEPSVKEFVIRDRVSGAMILPDKDPNGEFRSVYGLITVLNTRESERGPLGMLIFSGITSAGTQGAAEFFASPSSLKRLLEAFSRKGVNGFPPAYQVVVRCTYSNWQLLSYEFHSLRVLPKQ